MASRPSAVELDQFRTSLAETLGPETMMRLSAVQEEQPYLGIEGLAAYAATLLSMFAYAFVEELAKEAGKAAAKELVKVLKAAAAKIAKERPATVQEQQRSVAEVDAVLRDVTSRPEVKAAMDAAKAAGKKVLKSELEKIGLSEDDLASKAEEFVAKIMSQIGQ